MLEDVRQFAAKVAKEGDHLEDDMRSAAGTNSVFRYLNPVFVYIYEKNAARMKKNQLFFFIQAVYFNKKIGRFYLRMKPFK